MNSLFLLMYHGVLMPGRGIETLLHLTKMNPNVGTIILGNGNEKYIDSLKTIVSSLEIKTRVLFYPAVPISELWKYVGAVDASFMAIDGKAKSYYYALPNKFFESIQALTPIIASDFPEMKKIIDEYGIGVTCNPNNLDDINHCVERLRTDIEFYKKCKDNLRKAKEDLCWEHEKNVLIKAIKQYVILPSGI